MELNLSELGLKQSAKKSLFQRLATGALTATLAIGICTPLWAANVTFETSLENGKKYWKSNDAKVKVGETVNLVVKNTLTEPHGFAIEGLVEPIVLQPKEERKIQFVAKKKGTFAAKCQLHPAHVAANLIVE